MHSRLIRISLLLVFTTFFQFALAQNANPYYHFKRLNVQNGLVQNIVYHFLQDSRGYLWVGTRNGITLYDGIRTTNFQHNEQDSNSLRSDFVTRFLEDSDHRIWIGNGAGIDLFNQKGNRFIHYEIPGPDGKPASTFCVLLGFTNQNELWFIDTRSKAIRTFNTITKKFRSVCPTDAVDGTLTYDPHSGTVHIWTYLSMATTHFSFRKDSLVKTERFFDGNKKAGQPALLIFHVFFKNDTTAWLATAKGLIALNPKTGIYTIYNRLNKEPVTELRYISESPKGILWMGTGNAGIFTFDPLTKKFQDHYMDDALDPFSICSNNIVSLYFDRVGNIWCGSYGSGASYAHVENKFFAKHLSKNEMERWKKENNISWAGSDEQGNIWCMVQDVQGFWQLDSTLKLKTYHWPVLENGKPFIGAVYQLLFEGASEAWCTTDRGLFRYNIRTNKIKQVEYPQISSAVFGSYWSKVILRLRDSSIVFSTFTGVYHISKPDGKESIHPLFIRNGKVTGAIDMIFEDREQHLYIKDTEDSLYMLAPEDGPGRYRKMKTIAFRPEIFQFQENGNTLFMATAAGLFELNKNKLTIEKSAVNSLLPSMSLSNVLIKDDKIWLFGERGLYYYDTTRHTGRLFNEEDGLPANEFNEYTMIRRSSGDYVIGTSNGLLSFNPDKLQDTIYPPRAQLIKIYVNDSSTGFIETPQEYSNISLAYDQNTFSFDFSIIGFQHAEESVYEYKLENYDERWIRSGTTHYARYSKMAPGHYLFQIRILDANGRVSPYMKTLAIEIRKAFWQTIYFKMLMLLILLFLLWRVNKWWLGIRIRKEQIGFERQQAIEKERTRIATDMHDDLGAGLSRIKFLSDTIGMKKQLQQPVEEEISNISNYASEMIGKMGEIVWALNEKNDSLSDLLSYTRSYAVEYLLSNGIECQVSAPDEFPSLFVSGEFRRNIYLTIKEALHNIVKHAQAEKVMIGIEIDKELTITIQDNGSGFDIRNIRPFSNGLNNMQKRMRDIQGSLEIIQKKGTYIILTVPLPA
jgi:signal transduction histidine kinase/ligand-binding sensor domain-containing protein